MFGQQLSPHEWLNIPLHIRLRIHDDFGLTRSSFTEVVGGIVTSDGHTYEDLSDLTAERIEEYLEEIPGDLGFYVLVQKLVDKVRIDLDREEAERVAEKKASLFDNLSPEQVLTPGVQEAPQESASEPIINANIIENEQETKESNTDQPASKGGSSKKRSPKKKA